MLQARIGVAMAKERQFGETLTVPLTDEVLVWLKESSRVTGIPISPADSRALRDRPGPGRETAIHAALG